MSDTSLFYILFRFRGGGHSPTCSHGAHVTMLSNPSVWFFVHLSFTEARQRILAPVVTTAMMWQVVDGPLGPSGRRRAVESRGPRELLVG